MKIEEVTRLSVEIEKEDIVKITDTMKIIEELISNMKKIIVIMRVLKMKMGVMLVALV